MDYFEILLNERGQELYVNDINGFSEKILILGKWVVLGLKIACRHNSGSTLG